MHRLGFKRPFTHEGEQSSLPTLLGADRRSYTNASSWKQEQQSSSFQGPLAFGHLRLFAKIESGQDYGPETVLRTAKLRAHRTWP